MLRARFQDAQFFYEEDLKTPLADFRPQLAGTLFQKDLGTLLDKSVPPQPPSSRPRHDPQIAHASAPSQH